MPPEEFFTKIAGYSTEAQAYAVFSASYSSFPGLEAHIEVMAQRVGSGPILDLGCGCGRDSKRLAAAGCQVVSLDITYELLVAGAMRHMPKIGPVVADARSLPLRLGSMKGVIAVASLIHIPDDDVLEVVNEVRRVLCPGGQFLATVRTVPATGWSTQGIADPRWHASLDAKSLSVLLRATGFEVQSTSRSGGNWTALWATAD